MAGEFLLTFAMEQMLEKVVSLAADQVVRAWGVKAELERLAKSTRRIGAVLQNAEDKQEADGRVRDWLVSLNDIVYAAEDVLDEALYETLRQEAETRKPLKGKVRDFFSYNNPILFRLNMAHKVKKLNEFMADMEKQAMGELALESVVGIVRRAPQSLQLDRETDFRLDVSLIPIGREGDVSAIINMLEASSSSQRLLTMVAVVGMAGLGKTTLAQLVFKRVKKQKRFGRTIWCCVAEYFDYKKILRDMLQALGRDTDDTMTVQRMLDLLDDALQGENFLLVLDDVWNEQSVKWNDLKERLEKICKKGGNVVLITTRNKRVATTMETFPYNMYDLEGLSDDECWSIIKLRACVNDGDSLPPELEAIGKAIAGRCRGVPLAAKVVGGILRDKRAENWLSIKEDKVWDDVQRSEEIMPVLRLSFNMLPSPLKQCFAYCSLFPKDYEFQKEQLIEMWKAEGFLGTSINKGGKEILMSEERTGDDYFNHLLANSFFQDVERDKNGNISHCKMHDLIHDLSLLVSRSENCAFNIGLDSPASTIGLRCFDSRRLSLSSQDKQLLSIQGLPEFPRDGVTKLRSLFSNVDINTLYNFKSLRTLNLEGANFKALPSSIGKLKHMRYIDISRNNQIEQLPKSITNLYHLQTLRLLSCLKLKELPREMRKLLSLKHIYFEDEKLMPAEVGCLTNLQTLPLFAVGTGEGNKIQELKDLKELRGKLRITRLEHIPNGEEAERAKLQEKKNLSELSMEWSARASSCSSCNDEQVLEGLRPPSSLQRLYISGYMGKKIPGSPWMPKELEELILVHCIRCDELSTLGDLPYVKVLRIRGRMVIDLDEESRILKILGLEGVRDGEEARRAMLNEKTKLCELSLGWSATRHSSSGTSYNDEQVLQGLQPSSSLRRLKINNYMGSKIISCSSWIPTELEELKLVNCNRFKVIPTLGHLAHLKVVKIDGMTNIKSIGTKFYGNKSSSSNGSPPFPALRKLILRNMENLVEWMEPVMSGVETSTITTPVCAFPCLEALEIRKCPRLLTCSPVIQHLSALQTLRIEDCHMFREIPKLGHLHRLKICKIYGRIDIEFYKESNSVGDLKGKLSLKGSTSSSCHNEDVLEGLQSPPGVQSLQITNYMGKQMSCSSWIPAELVELELVNCKWCEEIPTLGHLAHLEVIKIQGMNSLKSIGMEFYGNKSNSSSNRDSPFPALKEFTLLEMVNLVQWMAPEVSTPTPVLVFPCLEVLTLAHCPRLTFISIINNLSSIKKLEIMGCNKLPSLPAGLHFCTSLSSLVIWSCKELTYVADEFTSLQELRIAYCPKLTSLPKGLLFLERLSIVCCDELANLTVGGGTSLTRLEIDYCPKLTRVDGLHLCTPLELLRIHGCSNLTCIPSIQHLTVLRILRISYCDGLTDLPMGLESCKSLLELEVLNCRGLTFSEDVLGCFTRLKQLSIGRFQELGQFPGLNSIHQLSGSLQELWIYGWSRLQSLPHQLQHLTSLTKLYVRDFDGVKTLPEWLCKLPSLENLDIWGCKNLESLPTATAMQCLSKLTELKIRDCPLLEKRCAKDSGPDWPNISHVQCIYINDIRIK